MNLGRRLAPGVRARDGSAGTLLPEADHVAGGVTDRRNPQVSFGVGRLDNLAAVCRYPLHSVVDVIDVDVWQQTGLPRYHTAGHPAADEVSGRIIKSGIIGVVLP